MLLQLLYTENYTQFMRIILLYKSILNFSTQAIKKRKIFNSSLKDYLRFKMNWQFHEKQVQPG